MKKKIGILLAVVGAILLSGALGTSDLETSSGFTGVPHSLLLLVLMASIGLVMTACGILLLQK